MYALRTILYAKLNRQDAASADVITAVTLNDEHRDYERVATLLGSAGKRSEALQALNLALQNNPSPEAYVSRAHFRDDTDADARLSDLDAALKLAPERVPALAAK